MSDAEITVGSTVKLRSGGPLMTVVSITAKSWLSAPDAPRDHARCVWFVGQSSVGETFAVASLTPAS